MNTAGNHTTFNDLDLIPRWSKDAINNVVTKSIMLAFKDGTFQAERHMTRAEVVVALARALPFRTIIYDKAGSYGDIALHKIYGDVIIKSPNVTLKNMDISGNLIFSKEIGDGNVSIEQVQVKGTTRIEGGGIDSIYILNSQLETLFVNRLEGTVRVLAEGSTNIQNTQILSSARLEEKDVLDKGFINLEVPSGLKRLGNVGIDGNFNNINIGSEVDEFKIDFGSIDNFLIQEKLDIQNILISKSVIIHELILKSEVTISGDGKINNIIMSDDSKNSILPITEVPAVSIGGGGADADADVSDITMNHNAIVKGALYYKHYTSEKLFLLFNVSMKIEGLHGTTGSSYYTSTDTSGNFSFSNIPPGTYLITAPIGDKVYFNKMITVQADQTLTLPDLIIKEPPPVLFVDSISAVSGHFTAVFFLGMILTPLK